MNETENSFMEVSTMTVFPYSENVQTKYIKLDTKVQKNLNQSI